jgi:rhodanese-related sulfurtransferase
MKKSLIVCLMLSLCSADDYKSLQFKGFEATYNNLKGESKSIKIKRERDNICSKIGMTHENFWSDNHSLATLPSVCTKRFVTTKGAVQPINIKDVETIGEIEVLRFIKESQTSPQKYMLVDARGKQWADEMTIPTAVNIPHSSVFKEEFFEDEYYSSMKKLGIKIVDDKSNKYNFENAKEIVVFCNGIWCPQSTRLIENLRDIGYPMSKIKWYRGGLQDWLSVNLTVISK